jgi:hypothetical protein
MERLRSVKETAEVLGISVYTVRAYVRQRKLAPVLYRAEGATGGGRTGAICRPFQGR